MTGKQVKELALKILDQNGLSDWTVYLDPMMAPVVTNRHTLGRCVFTSKEIIISYIHAISKDEHDVYLTILHEVAHALTPNHGHDVVWLRKLRELGSDEQSPVIALAARTINGQVLEDDLITVGNNLVALMHKIRNY